MPEKQQKDNKQSEKTITIRSLTFKKEKTIPLTEWDRMKELGHDVNFKVVSKSK